VRQLRLALLVLAGACASAGAPPGGPEDKQPPQVVKVTPDSGETSAKVKEVEFQFDEVVSDRSSGQGAGISQYFLISPRNGATEASWHRSRITVRPKNGFRDNTAYRITLLPGLADLRGNIRKEPATVVFSTGATFPPFTIRGRAFDLAAQRPAPNAYIEAAVRGDTSVVYVGTADTSGTFTLGPINSNTYLIRAIIDQNNNRVLDRNEKWDSTTITIGEAMPPAFVELDAIERDSLPPLIDNVAVIDSVTIRVSFDKYLDPLVPLQPALVSVQRADSSQLEIARVEGATPFERARQARDSVRRADSLRALPRRDSAAAPVPTPPPVPTPGGARPAPAPAKPKALAPERAIVITLAPSSVLTPGASYRVSVRGFRNLSGRAHEPTACAAQAQLCSRPFTAPKPAPPKPPADSTRRPPTDSTRRPPPGRGR
jgi:hypothetical protein